MEPLKNLLNSQVIENCAFLIKRQYPPFQEKEFLQSFHSLESLELKERCLLITNQLDQYMPQSFEDCEKIIYSLLLKNDTTHNEEYLSGWILWPIQMFFIQRFSSNINIIKSLVYLLKDITPHFSSEFSIRYLIKNHFELVHPILTSFTKNDNHHVRRWISEGTRPRLPWGIKLDVFCKTPELNNDIIKSLQSDESIYVRKSVANHLNDISKDNPQFVINWINSYLEEAKQNPLLMWTFKHGLRTLIKKGNIDALKILGVSENVAYQNYSASIEYQTIIKNEKSYQIICVNFDSLIEEKMILDFKLKYPGKNALKNKIIKGKNFDSIIGKNTVIKKINLFDNSISKFDVGDYCLEIILNGRKIDHVYWKLVSP